VITRRDAISGVCDVTDREIDKWFTESLKKTGKGVIRAGVDVVSSVTVKAIQAYTRNG
jgi:hypothetical protein